MVTHSLFLCWHCSLPTFFGTLWEKIYRHIVNKRKELSTSQQQQMEVYPNIWAISCAKLQRWSMQQTTHPTPHGYTICSSSKLEHTKAPTFNTQTINLIPKRLRLSLKVKKIQFPIYVPMRIWSNIVVINFL